MAFNAFQVMREAKKGGQPVRPADPVPEMTVEQAVNCMDRLFCLVIASLMQRKKGMDKTHLHDARNSGVANEAREAALVCARWERTGIEMRRDFSRQIWAELITFTSLERVQLFCQSPMMAPSVLWRVILTEVSDVEA